MGFCANCGQPRSGSGRFCSTCGSEFKDSPDDQGGPPTEEAARPGPAVGMIRANVVPDLPDIPLAQTDSFKSWYQPASPSAGQSADSNWEQTQTVQATPAQATGNPPTAFTPSNPFSSANPVMPPAPPGRSYPPGPQAAPPARGGGGKGLFIALAVIVVLAAGGGAYALATTLGRHSTAQPSTSPTVEASTSASGATSSGTSPTATPSPALSLVAVSPGVTASAGVETLLSHYFQGINTHSYTEYASTLNPAMQAKETASQFASGYASTTDSGMTLTDLASSSDGGLTATVTFTSRQSPSQSVDNSACNAWTLNLYLVPQGSGYLIGPAPSGYQPTYSDC